MLWFPVQGWAALVAPLCQHTSNAEQTADRLVASVAEAGEHCQHHRDAPAVVDVTTVADKQVATEVAQCDHCSACHLAHTPMLTPLPLSLPCAAPAQRAENAAVFYYQLFLEQPQRPPLPLV